MPLISHLLLHSLYPQSRYYCLFFFWSFTISSCLLFILFMDISLWGNAKQKWQFWTVHTTKSSRLKPIMNTPCIRGSKWGSKNIGWGRGGGGGKQLVKGMGEVEEMICRGRRRQRGIGNLSLPSKLRQHWYILFRAKNKKRSGRKYEIWNAMPIDENI